MNDIEKQIINFNFSNQFQVPTIYIIIDKKEREKIKIRGGGFISTNQALGIYGGSQIKGDSFHEYIIIIKNIFTEKIEEKSVTVTDFYNSKIGDYFQSQEKYSIIKNLQIALTSLNTTKILYSSLLNKYKKNKELYEELILKKNKLSNHIFSKNKLIVIQRDIYLRLNLNNELNEALNILNKYILIKEKNQKNNLPIDIGNSWNNKMQY